MKPQNFNRRSIRLRGYDYTQSGAYFITICTYNRKDLFGEIIAGKMNLNDAGNITKQYWMEIPDHFPIVSLDEFVIMPDHIHGIIVINDNNSIGANDNCMVFNDDLMGANNNCIRTNNYSPLHQQQKHHHQKTPFRSPSKTIGSVIRGFKIGVTKWFHQNTNIDNVWQRNYYDHIIRNDEEIIRIRKYIKDNPVRAK